LRPRLARQVILVPVPPVVAESAIVDQPVPPEDAAGCPLFLDFWTVVLGARIRLAEILLLGECYG
ncbi:MAG: hypothetical protein KKC21_05935, partial [Nitrospinae bacterium]|nr:hypothetical protein [Nitrospinota bacterium]